MVHQYLPQSVYPSSNCECDSKFLIQGRLQDFPCTRNSLRRVVLLLRTIDESPGPVLLNGCGSLARTHTAKPIAKPV